MDQNTTASHDQQMPTTPVDESGTVLALGVEVNRLTACLLEPVRNQYRLAAWWTEPSGFQRSVAEQIHDLLERFGNRIQRQLWDHDRNAPYSDSTDYVRNPPLAHVAIVASPRPRLRVWVAGLSVQNSLAAAKEALQASQAQLIGTTSLQAGDEPQTLAHDLNASRPEALVLAGGYDTHQPHSPGSLVALSQLIAAALHDMPDGALPEIIFTGNAQAYGDVASILQTERRHSLHQVENVYPAPGQAHVQALSQAVDNLYWQKCQRMRDFSELEKWNTAIAPMMTIESSFTRLVQLWLTLNDLPELYGIYAGSDRWLHIWADAQTERVLARFTTPGTPGESSHIESWRPPLRLVSGPWLDDEDLPNSVLWWDSMGLAPAVAAAARTAPQAAVEALRNDLLIRRDK